jgi:hypothetical protein
LVKVGGFPLVTVIVAVAAALALVPSLARNVKLSVPLRPLARGVDDGVGGGV